MFDLAQRQYIEEVLGADPNVFNRRLEAAPEVVRVTVLTASLSAEESSLLDKILSSIHLVGHKAFQLSELNFQTQPPLPTKHVLSFSGGEVQGRHNVGDFIWWGLPQVSEMLSGENVTEKKKMTWALLQQFNRENSP